MKKTLLTIAAGILISQSVQSAVQSLPFTDHFTYTNGNLFTVAAGVWDAGGNTGPELLVTNSAALTAPPGFSNAWGNGVKWQPSGTARRAIVQFSSVSTGTLYASFLINVLTPPSSGSKLVAYFDSSTSQPSSPQLGVFVSNGSIGVGKKASAPGVSASVSSGTHLVVVRYTFQDGNDQADLWVDPTNTTYGAATAPSSLGSTTGGSDQSSIPYFGICTASGSGPMLYIDEVRISTNWADVTPGTPPPPPTSTPQVTHVEMTDQGFVIQGIGGTSNGVFDILASTDMTVPIDQWNAIATFNFDAGGNFNVTNPVPEGADAEFFVLHVSAASTNTPPSITSQPQNQMVLLGQTASFTVTASGSLPLNYQWYFDTNTLLSAATNATLTISDVQSNNVGGYSVVVANSAGSVTSVVATLSIGEPVTNGDFYVSNTGTDTNPGTFAAPFFNVQKAVDLAQPSNTIYVRGGTFPYVNTIRITNSGTAFAPINLFAYPGEHPVLDYSSQPVDDSSRGMYVLTNANYWHIKGLELAHCGDNAVKLEGSYNTFEQCVFHDNQDTGLQIGFGHQFSNPGDLAAHNLILNCDSYHNYDTATKGGNADGFACKMHAGAGNVFIGCRSWFNSDDGWDLFESDHTVIISNCWTWHNGDKSLFPPSSSFGGNGNGFKMGGNGSGGSSEGTHYAIQCIAFNENFQNTSKCGFTDNSHADGEILLNCVAFGCNYNFFFEQSVNSGKSNVFANCVSFSGGSSGNPVPGVSFGSGTVIQQNNTWTLTGLTANAADFTDTTEAMAVAPRQADGSLPTGFMRLVAGSDLIDQGVNVGLPYTGSAPDLGAYEFEP
jgi:pectate disaccharide-lyase